MINSFNTEWLNWAAADHQGRIVDALLGIAGRWLERQQTVDKKANVREWGLSFLYWPSSPGASHSFRWTKEFHGTNFPEPLKSRVWWIKDTLCNPSLILSSVLTEAFSHSNTQFALLLQVSLALWFFVIDMFNQIWWKLLNHGINSRAPENADSGRFPDLEKGKNGNASPSSGHTFSSQ